MKFDKYVKKTYNKLQIILTKKAIKQIENAPRHIQIKFIFWIDLLSDVGLREARKYSGFHDEPLKGRRLGQRSVRLSKAYRAIYLETGCDQYQIIEVVEVNKHDY